MLRRGSTTVMLHCCIAWRTSHMPSLVFILHTAEAAARISKSAQTNVKTTWRECIRGFGSDQDPVLYCITCPGSMRCPGCPSAQRSYSPLSDQNPPRHWRERYAYSCHTIDDQPLLSWLDHRYNPQGHRRRSCLVSPSSFPELKEGHTPVLPARAVLLSDCALSAERCAGRVVH